MRRSKAGGKLAKARRRKMVTPKRRNTPKALPNRGTSIAGEVVARLTRECDQAREREEATVEILRVIASSPDNAQPVFNAIVKSGLKLFPGALISIAVPVGDQVTTAAIGEPNSRRAGSWRGRFPFPLTRQYMHGIAILDAKVVDIPDVTNAPLDLTQGAQNFLTTGYRDYTTNARRQRDWGIECRTN